MFNTTRAPSTNKVTLYIIIISTAVMMIIILNMMIPLKIVLCTTILQKFISLASSSKWSSFFYRMFNAPKYEQSHSQHNYLSTTVLMMIILNMTILLKIVLRTTIHQMIISSVSSSSILVIILNMILIQIIVLSNIVTTICWPTDQWPARRHLAYLYLGRISQCSADFVCTQDIVMWCTWHTLCVKNALLQTKVGNNQQLFSLRNVAVSRYSATITITCDVGWKSKKSTKDTVDILQK